MPSSLYSQLRCGGGEIRVRRVVTPRLDANPPSASDYISRYAHFEGNYCSNLLYLYLVIQKYVSGAIIHSTNKVLLGLPAMYAFS